ncbi:MAG: type IV pilus assembly protein PilM [bacterium]|nr:type IV pilus assembly protein PilM [bacterium]
MFWPKVVTSIDIGTTAIKIIQRKRTSHGWIVTEAVKKEIPLEIRMNDQESRDFIVAFLRESFSQSSHELKANIILSVNRGSAIIKFIKLPSTDGDEISKMLPFEIEKHLPVSLGKAVISSQIVGEDIEGETRISNIALVMVRRDIVDERISLLSAAGLKPVMINLSSFGLYNRFKQLYGNNQESQAIIEIGTNNTEVNIISDGKLKFTRSAPIGGATLNQILQKNLKINLLESERVKLAEPVFERSELQKSSRAWGEELVREINQSLDSFRLENKTTEITKLLISGGGSELPGLKEFLEQKLGIPTIYLGATQDEAEKTEGSHPENKPSLQIALGLALQLSGKSWPGINLVPADILDTRSNIKKKKYSILLAVIVGVLVIYASAHSYLVLDNKKKEIARINTELAAIKDDVAQARDLQKKTVLYRGWLDDRSQVLEGLRVISVAATPEIYIDHLVYDSLGQVSIRGKTKSYIAVTRFVLQLDQAHHFAKVAMKESREAQYGNQNLIEFAIDCQLKDAVTE